MRARPKSSRSLNKHLFRNTSDDRYATLFYAIYDSEAKTLTYTNAGHLAPIFVNDGPVQALSRGRHRGRHV